MYRIQPSNGLGFSLTPPDWLKKIVTGVTGGAVQVVNPVQPVPAPTPQFLNLSAESTMPTWVIPAAIGGVVLMLMMTRRRSRA